MSAENKIVGVFGGGLMGGGVAQTLAQNDYPLYLNDLTEELVSTTRTRIEKGLNKAAKGM